MATLQEIVSECFPASPTGQEKTAAAKKQTSTSEVNSLLQELGVADTETVKTAAQQVEETVNGGSMAKGSLADIYNQIMSESAPGTEKTAAVTEVPAATAVTEEGGPIADFGTLVGEYFGDIAGAALEKNAFDLDTTSGKGEQPQAHAPGAPSALGSPGDPAMPVNHSASSGAHLNVTTGGTTPYTLKGAALKSVLKRMKEADAPVGSITQ